MSKLNAQIQTDILLFLSARNGEKYPTKETMLAAINEGFGVKLTQSNIVSLAGRLRKKPTDFYESNQGLGGGIAMPRIERLERMLAALYRKLGEVPSEPLD